MLKIANSLNRAVSRTSLVFMMIAVAVPAASGMLAEPASDAVFYGIDEQDDYLYGRQPRPVADVKVRVSLSPDELDLLARLVAAEARGETYTGQVAVAAVVLNRMDSPLFPSDLRQVIYQPRQFQPVDHGTIHQPATDEARAATVAALRGEDPTGGAIFFFNPYKANSPFLWARPVTVWIGQHRFSR